MFKNQSRPVLSPEQTLTDIRPRSQHNMQTLLLRNPEIRRNVILRIIPRPAPHLRLQQIPIHIAKDGIQAHGARLGEAIAPVLVRDALRVHLAADDLEGLAMEEEGGAVVGEWWDGGGRIWSEPWIDWGNGGGGGGGGGGCGCRDEEGHECGEDNGPHYVSLMNRDLLHLTSRARKEERDKQVLNEGCSDKLNDSIPIFKTEGLCAFK